MPILLTTSLPGPKSQRLMREREMHVARGPFHATPLFISRARGALVEDVDGNILVDFAAGIGVVNVGHTPPTVVEALSTQAHHFLHASFNVTPYEGYVRLCEKLNRLSPGNFPKKSFLANSGAEAVENAVKIARAFTGRKHVVSFEHAFHGRTFMAMALTSKVKPYKEGFGPLPDHVHRAPFPYTYRWPTTSDPEKVSEECFHAFEQSFTKDLPPSVVAAVVIEPVLGEGGFITVPKAFLRRLSAFCKTHKILLIADEIQTGFGRTGTLFACEQLELVPDLLLTAKGLGAGMPISAVTGRAEVMDSPVVGGIGGTFGGNPLSCAAALAVFDLFEKGDLLQKARQLGQLLEVRLAQWAAKYPCIGEARGLGPMRAIELVTDKRSKDPNPELAKNILKFCYEHGVLLLNAGTYGNVIRFLPPLVIETEDLNAGLDVVEDALKTVA